MDAQLGEFVAQRRDQLHAAFRSRPRALACSLAGGEHHDSVDFDLRAARQLGYADGGPRRVRRCEIVRHDFVYAREVRHRRQVYGEFYEVSKLPPAAAATARKILEHLMDLGVDVRADELHRLWIERDLTGQINRCARFESACE